ncbi:Hsp33 family molecular chaperone HslO [Anaerotalea alkaliphila]|uniref:33 kDa chaperonin n=1 Tax=Anaerotalea alkaliphila TaxID=2662126 RepID=A0A7X5HTT6_9FIRM|nr:Hsp33 family molecular chaperone HslO [Anaerotalea alkaliphila]NDL66552.1 Hsp33 family molecular chaperone HslO [Anaerotalea alkaliphila]
MENRIIRGTAANHQVRAFAADTRQLVEEARRIHDTSPVATAALGRLLTAGSMMGAMLKGEQDVLTLQVRGNGPLEGILVTVDSKSRVKGYVNHPEVDLPLNSKGKLDVAEAVGIGLLTVIKDIGMKEPYVGQTHLVTSEIAEDLTYYFATSEQTPSAVALGVLIDRDRTVKQSGGFIIQLLPEAEEDAVNRLETNLSRLRPVTELLEEGNTMEDILGMVMEGLDFVVSEVTETSYYCNCSKEKVAEALFSVGKEELEDMIGEGKPVELHCHFCNSRYLFEIDEVKDLRDRIG